MSNTWERQDNESNLWYNRFDVFRLLGPRRSIERAFKTCKETDALTADRPGAIWYTTAKLSNWRQRAEAWDEVERTRLRSIEQQRREDARNHRIKLIDTVLDVAFERLIQHLDLPDPKAINVFRLVFKDMLSQNRADMPPDFYVNENGELIQITADDLLEAQRQLASWQEPVRTLRTEDAQANTLDLRTCLIRLYPDSVSARRIADQAGLDTSRIAISDKAIDTWHAILSQATLDKLTPAIVNIARSEYPRNEELQQL